jgi:hypothetical protein
MLPWQFGKEWNATALISKFLKVPSTRIGRPLVDDVAYPKIPSTDVQQYAKARQHKAIAANKLDAEERALFGCGDAALRNTFLSETHLHHCILVDVDGKRLVK